MIWSIYKHTNKVNGKSYIGYTQQNPRRRWGGGSNYKDHPKFYRAIKKYGWNNFTHTIVAWATTEDVAIAEETFQKIKYNTIENGYNCVLNENDSPMLGRKHSEESKRKIGAFWKGKKRKPFTEEHKLKIKIARANQIMTEESNRKRSATQIGREPGYHKLTNDQVLIIFNDTRKTAIIAKEFGVNDKTITNIKNGTTWSKLTKR